MLDPKGLEAADFKLDEEELNTILAVGRNEQSGRITNFELKELVRVYRAAQALRNQPALAQGDAEPVAWDGKTWFELREPGRVPERKGPIPDTSVAAFLRELFEHRPKAYVTVITIGRDGPSLQDGPECLQMLDGRSMSTVRKHIASSSAAHNTAALASMDEVK